MVNDCIEHFCDEVLLWPFEKLLETDGVPTAEIRMRFRAPSRHGDRLRLPLEILRFGRSAMDYRLIATCDGQVRQALRNIAAIVEAAGGQVSDVTRMTWFVTDKTEDLARQAEEGAVCREVFGRHFPAMSMVVVAGLIEDEAVVEIEATAHLG